MFLLALLGPCHSLLRQNACTGYIFVAYLYDSYVCTQIAAWGSNDCLVMFHKDGNHNIVSVCECANLRKTRLTRRRV